MDAHDGQILQHSETVRFATGTGTTTFYGEVDLATVKKNGTFYLEDRDARIGTFDGCGEKEDLSSISDNNNVWNGTAKRQVVNAHYAATAWYHYMDGVHGREGVDDELGPGLKGAKKDPWNVLSIGTGGSTRWVGGSDPHVCVANGQGTLDIVGHELTHGWLEHSVDLLAGDETSPLGESLADIGGALVEHDVLGADDDRWIIGEDAQIFGQDAFRSMIDPPSLELPPALFFPECWEHRTTGELRFFDPDAGCIPLFPGDPCPDDWVEVYRDSSDDGLHVDHLDDFVDTTCGVGDVGRNTGIPNHAFYTLQADIGVADAADIWFRAIEHYLTDTADFADARQAMIDAAEDLFGATSDEVSGVEDAWDHVGVE